MGRIRLRRSQVSRCRVYLISLESIALILLGDQHAVWRPPLISVNYCLTNHANPLRFPTAYRWRHRLPSVDLRRDGQHSMAQFAPKRPRHTKTSFSFTVCSIRSYWATCVKTLRLSMLPALSVGQAGAWCQLMTSPARPGSLSGNAMPSTFAVLRLITNSTLIACCTGRSLGFSPLRMRPV